MGGIEKDTQTNRYYFVHEFESFGPVWIANEDCPVGGAHADWDYDIEYWRNIAAEAVLLYGNAGYNGMDLDPDFVRFRLDGKVLTRRDYGYTCQ